MSGTFVGGSAAIFLWKKKKIRSAHIFNGLSGNPKQMTSCEIGNKFFFSRHMTGAAAKISIFWLQLTLLSDADTFCLAAALEWSVSLDLS